MAATVSEKASKYPSISGLASSPKAALDQTHSPIRFGHTSARVSLKRQPIWSPRYMNSEKFCAGIPALSNTGLKRASWMEGMPADNEGMLISATGLGGIRL